MKTSNKSEDSTNKLDMRKVVDTLDQIGWEDKDKNI